MMMMATSSLGRSFNLPITRREEQKDEEGQMMGYLTMGELKGSNFNGDYLRSLSSFDRLRLVATLFLLKETQDDEQFNKEEEANKATKNNATVSFSADDFNSTTTMVQFHNLVPGLVQGKYFNLGFDEAYPLNKKKQQQQPIEPKWVLHPKKPRTASNFGQNPTMRPSQDKGVKRKYNSGDHHDYNKDDKDWAATKKKKKIVTQKGSSTTYFPPPDLPDEYKELIIGRMNGTELTLLIQKELFISDVNPNLNRLSLPPHQVLSDNFLKPDEIQILHQRPKQGNQDQGSLEIPFTCLRPNRRNPDQGCLKVPFIDPRLKLEFIKGINLKMWKLSNSEKIRSYALKTTWNKVVNKNKLGEGDVIQVWSFRANNNQLHLAIVVVKRAQKSSCQSEGSCSKSSKVVDGDDQGSKGVEGATMKLWTGTQKIHMSEKQEEEELKGSNYD